MYIRTATCFAGLLSMRGKILSVSSFLDFYNHLVPSHWASLQGSPLQSQKKNKRKTFRVRYECTNVQNNKKPMAQKNVIIKEIISWYIAIRRFLGPIERAIGGGRKTDLKILVTFVSTHTNSALYRSGPHTRTIRLAIKWTHFLPFLLTLVNAF